MKKLKKHINNKLIECSTLNMILIHVNVGDSCKWRLSDCLAGCSGGS